MSIPQETPVFTYEEASGCGCFRKLCFSWDDGTGNHYLLKETSHKELAWLVANLKRVKEFSELVAGPKWKNFIRKIGKLCNYIPKKSSNNKQTTQFQYTPESYALNFCGDQDQDQDQDQEDDSFLMHNFSSRFASASLINDQHRKGTVF